MSESVIFYNLGGDIKSWEVYDFYLTFLFFYEFTILEIIYISNSRFIS